MSEEWVKVAEEDDLPDGAGMMVHGPEDNHIALFKVDGEFHAINHVCPHQGGPLADGTFIDDFVVACPWHGWEFDVRNGESPSHEAHVDVYAVKVEDNEVFVGPRKKEGNCKDCQCGGGQ